MLFTGLAGSPLVTLTDLMFESDGALASSDNADSSARLVGLLKYTFLGVAVVAEVGEGMLSNAPPPLSSDATDTFDQKSLVVEDKTCLALLE